LITSFAMLGMLMAFSNRNARDAAATPARPRPASSSRNDSEPFIPEAVE
jgi:hypothetical protein